MASICPRKTSTGSWRLMRDHILRVLCKGNAEVFEYLPKLVGAGRAAPRGRRGRPSCCLTPRSDERRYLVLAVDDSVQQDSDYFRLLNEELENGGLAAMLHELLTRDIRSFNHRVVPTTNALIEQKLLSLEPDQEWWFGKLQRGALTGFAGGWGLVNKQALHDDYVECVKQVGVSRRSTQTSLGMHLSRLLPPGFPKSVTASSGLNGVPVSAPHYRFPSLDVCRKFFENSVGLQGYDWGGTLEGETLGTF